MYKTSKIIFSPRVRKSPYFDSTIKHGATAFTVYNHMYLPIGFEGTLEDYKKVIDGDVTGIFRFLIGAQVSVTIGKVKRKFNAFAV